jgi:hypothetical protein
VHGLGDSAIGGRAADHLHQLQDRRRVEEVHAHQPSRALERRGDGGDGQGRGIGREDAPGVADRFQVGEYPALGFEVLDHGFDDQRRGTEGSQIIDRVDAAQQGVTVSAAHPAALHQPVEPFCGAADPLLRRIRRGIVQQHRVAGRGGDLGDARAHGAGADDGYRRAGRKGAQLPLKRGSRFSMNALTPSR